MLWVDCGPRPQETAAMLMAQVVACVRTLSLRLTDGWQAYPAARLQGVGERRRHRGQGDRKPQPRLGAPPALCYAPVVQVRDKTGHIVEVHPHVVVGGPRRGVPQVRVASGHDHPERLEGTVVWQAAGAGGAMATTFALPVLGSHPASRTRLAAGEPLSWREAA